MSRSVKADLGNHIYHVIFERDYKIAIDALIRNIKNFSGKK
jgi:hypothetical protein